MIVACVPVPAVSMVVMVMAIVGVMVVSIVGIMVMAVVGIMVMAVMICVSMVVVVTASHGASIPFGRTLRGHHEDIKSTLSY